MSLEASARSRSSSAIGAAAPALAPLVAASQAVVMVLDRDRRVVYANHRLDDASAPVPNGTPVEALVPLEHAERVSSSCEAAISSSKVEEFELGRVGPGGPERWFAATVSPIPGEHGPEGALLVLMDVTQRKQLEERLRRSEALLVDAQGVAHMGTWEWDVTQPHAWWSPELYRIYGLTPEEYTPSYEAYLKMVHPDDRARVATATERVFKEHVPYSHDERIFRPDGTMRYLHTWAMPVLDSAGKLARLVGVCQDVTEQRRADAAVRTQTLTRALAKRIVLDLMRRGQIPERALKDMGRSLVHEQNFEEPSVARYVSAFVDMGLGELRFVDEKAGRSTFVATDLLERRADSTLPTCATTLGYLEGVVAIMTGKTARGNEMRCQSMGHKECVFVIMAQ